MATKDSLETDTADREIVITRRFDVHRDLVWRALSEPEHLIQWWGPTGFTNTFHEIDVRPGGVWRFIMHGPDGTNFDNYVRFLEVVERERLVFDQGSRADDVMHSSSIVLEDADGGTLVTLRVIFPTRARRDEVVKKFNAIEGGNQTLARLAEHLRTM